MNYSIKLLASCFLLLVMIACPSQTKAPEQHNAVLTPTCCKNTFFPSDDTFKTVYQWCLPDCSGCGDNQSGDSWESANDSGACGSVTEPSSWEYPKTCLTLDSGCGGPGICSSDTSSVTDSNNCYQMCYSNCASTKATIQTPYPGVTVNHLYLLPYCSFQGVSYCPRVIDANTCICDNIE